MFQLHSQPLSLPLTLSLCLLVSLIGFSSVADTQVETPTAQAKSDSESSTTKQQFTNKVSSALTQTSTVATLPFHLTPHIAHYQAFSGRKKLGSGTRTLSVTNQADTTLYTLSFTSIAKWLFLSDKRTESTLFERQNNQIKSHKFTLDRSGTGPNKHYEVSFDYDKKQVRNKKSHVMNGIEWRSAWLDPMSEQLQIELDLSQLALKETLIGKQLEYHFLNRKAQPQYRVYEIVELTEEELPIGPLNVIKLRRQYPEGEKKKIKEMWFAPSMNFMLVRMIKKDGSDKFDMVIQDFKKSEPTPKPPTKPTA